MNLKNTIPALSLAVISLLALESCTQSSGEANMQMPAQELPVFKVKDVSATTYKEFPARIEGTQVIEIRPQVNGYLDEIRVDEGAHVKKGQILFKIDDHVYSEQFNNAKAQLATAKADLANASIEVSKLKPLVQNKVVSEVKLKAAEAAYDAATANVDQAEAMVRSAAINVGYTLVKAPFDGYIGSIPFKTGSLVGVAMEEPLTVISEVKEMYGYFSFSEIDFLEFTKEMEGNTIDEKLHNIPPVELTLADNSLYPYKGEVETASGQFNKTTGAITLRATFPNTKGLLRSGLTGKIRIPHSVSAVIAIPQASTFELQDKTLVFVLDESNVVKSVPIAVSERYGNFYLVENGVEVGQQVVYAGLDRLRDGATIKPKPVSMDSLLKSNTF